MTGATGFIGTALCKKLSVCGATVIGTSRRSPDPAKTNWVHHPADLSDADQVDRLFAEVSADVVIHLASCVTGGRDIEWVRATMAGNLQSAVNVMVAAQQSGVSKTVLAGSLEEPGAAEQSPVPASPFAASKWCTSAYARMLHSLYGFRVAVARIFMVYGPGQRDLSKFVPYVCIAAANGQAPRLMSGHRPVDWIFIDDVVDGLIAMAVDGPDDGSYVDLGNGELFTTGEVAERLCEIADTGVSPEFGVLRDRPFEPVRVADADLSESILGWTAKTDLASGLADTYRWYQHVAAQPASTRPGV